MRKLSYSPLQTQASRTPTTHLAQVKALSCLGLFFNLRAKGGFPGVKIIWWDASSSDPYDSTWGTKPQEFLPGKGALKSTKLALALARRGRQAVGEFLLTLSDDDVEVSRPLTLFTGSWVAQLLGYPRKYRGAKLIEAFMGSALRSYLILYNFMPFRLCLKGPFFNFNFFWKVINNPTTQVFIHPITMEIIWDIRFPPSVAFSLEKIKEAMAAAAAEFGRGGLPSLEDEILSYEARIIGERGEAGEGRYKFSWDQILFLPTRIDNPRRRKKARSIRKRLSKRLVRASGRRFWVG